MISEGFGKQVVRALTDPSVVIQGASNFARCVMRARTYSGLLSQTLENRLPSDLTAQERYSLDAEIDLVRIVAADTLKVYDAAMSKGATPETVAMATVQARTALEFVINQVDKAARLRIDRGDSLDDEARDDLLDNFAEQVRASLGDAVDEKAFKAAVEKARSSTSIMAPATRTLSVRIK